MSANASPGSLLAVWLGQVPFATALALQEEAREAIANGVGQDVLFLCEHPPVLTMGRRATANDLLWSQAQREAAGVEVVETPRGGEVTLHAPGQLVAYPVVYVGKKIRAHIHDMAHAAIAVLQAYGVDGLEFRWEHPGVWQQHRKFASVGVHVSRGVAIQGLSLNIDVDAHLFSALISCGLPQAEMVSLAAFAQQPLAPAMLDYARLWAQAYGQVRGVEIRWSLAAAKAWLAPADSP